jgi:hypothetical protein
MRTTSSDGGFRILGQALSGWGIPFISAKATHSHSGSQGEVVCETKEQCDAIAARATMEGWGITTRVATPEEVAEAKRWAELW